MACFSHDQEHPKLSNTCKLLPNVLKEACCRCHVPCLSISFPLDDSDEADTASDGDIDNLHEILMEIKSSAMKAKATRKERLFPDSFRWVVSPTTGKLLIEPKEEHGGEDDCESSEAFFSVKSFLSRCSSGCTSECEDYRGGRSIWEEFCHCEGWPFGLCRRALVLPPLPSSPSDSWTWSKKSLNSKVCAAVSLPTSG